PLADPTRPPNVLPETAEAAFVEGPRLQSVLISPGRRSAVISGTTVAQGGRFGDARVELISESAVVLRYADRRETLQLLPSQDKRARRAAATRKENSQ
ncbi:MAG TPA: MSHA biogenesis protein MshK, partial [Burkholderiales bacterium]|nr:MSHA biogenesis protein MshK [Burkholderiales bacterium]